MEMTPSAGLTVMGTTTSPPGPVLETEGTLTTAAVATAAVVDPSTSPARRASPIVLMIFIVRAFLTKISVLVRSRRDPRAERRGRRNLSGPEIQGELFLVRAHRRTPAAAASRD